MSSGPDPEAPVARLRPGGRSMGIRRPRRPPRPVSAGPEPARENRLVEWHALGPGEREEAWQELVAWVVWMHDRYELSVEERLPVCWPQHPGLIEELHALRIWRLEIYADAASAEAAGGRAAEGGGASGGGAGGGGQAARYWHAELRQVLHAATTWYAAGCRSGHRASSRLEETVRRRWLGADPSAGIPEDLLRRTPTVGPAPVRKDVGMSMSRAAMEAALADGSARPLGELITEWVEYDGTWWTPTPADPARGIASGWERIADPHFNAELDAAAAQMRAADDVLNGGPRPDPGDRPPGRPYR